MPSNVAVRPPLIYGSHGTNSSLSSAVTIAVASSGYIEIEATTQNVRVTVDGSTTPSASTGFLVEAGSSRLFIVEAGKNVKVIEVTASASIQYQLYQH